MVLSYESGILLFSDSYSGSLNYSGIKGKDPQDPIKTSSSLFALYQLSKVASKTQSTEEECSSHHLWLEKVPMIYIQKKGISKISQRLIMHMNVRTITTIGTSAALLLCTRGRPWEKYRRKTGASSQFIDHSNSVSLSSCRNWAHICGFNLQGKIIAQLIQ
jgi:hypothetical protein